MDNIEDEDSNHEPIPDFELQGNNNRCETEIHVTMEVDIAFH